MQIVLLLYECVGTVLSDTGDSPLTVAPTPDMLALKRQQVAAKTVPTTGGGRLLTKAREQRSNSNRWKLVVSNSAKMNLFLHHSCGYCGHELYVHWQKEKNGEEMAKPAMVESTSRGKSSFSQVSATPGHAVMAPDSLMPKEKVQACMRSKHRCCYICDRRFITLWKQTWGICSCLFPLQGSDQQRLWPGIPFYWGRTTTSAQMPWGQSDHATQAGQCASCLFINTSAVETRNSFCIVLWCFLSGCEQRGVLGETGPSIRSNQAAEGPVQLRFCYTSA